MSATFRGLSAITATGAAVYVLVVLLLQLLQPDLDPATHYMSELAFGRFGGFLLVALVGLAAAIGAVAVNLRVHKATRWLPLLLGLAAVCFLAAGLVTLSVSARIHVSLVASAFWLCCLCMILLPRSCAAFSGIRWFAISWGCCIVMCGITALGGSLIPPGIAQRFSALVLLFWFSIVAWRLAR